MDKNLNSTYTMHTGRDIPIIGLGTWQLSDPATSVGKALELGYPMIDTSGDYGTQPGVGKAMEQSKRSRDDVYIVTKIEAHEDAYLSAKQNLDELKMDYADLMLVHWPPKMGPGLHLWEGLLRARREGLIQDAGVSNYSIEQMEQLYEATGELPAVNQIEWTPFGYDQDMLEFCRENNIVIQSYSPLTRGKKLDHDVLADIAEKYDKTTAQILIRWNIELGVVPIVKAGSPEHQKENIDVFDFSLNEEDMNNLAELNERYSAISSAPAYM